MSDLRGEILGALNTFHAHVKYTITLLTTILAVALGLPAFAIENQPESVSYFCMVSALLFLALIPAARWALKICRRYYMIYASNYIYYARQHRRCPDAVDHPWIRDLYLKQGFDDDSICSDEAMDDFIESRRSSDNNSWRYYRVIIICIGVAGAVGAVLTLAGGVVIAK